MTYWEKRKLAAVERAEKHVSDAVPEMIKAFERAKKDIIAQVEQFYGRYAKNNQVSLEDARKTLSRQELAKFKGSLKDFEKLARKAIGRFDLEVENLSMKARVSRLEALQAGIEARLQELYQFERGQAEGVTRDVFLDSYYHGRYDMFQATGNIGNFAVVPDAVVKKVLETPVMGADISTRLWRQDIDTGFKIRQALNTMMATGRPPDYFAEELQKTIGAMRKDKDGNITGTGKKYEAYRLLYNEASFAQAQADLQMYRDTGVEQYQILATLDTLTSKICREQDGKIYNLDDAVIGVNMHPFHVNCRTTSIPVVEGFESTERAARDPETGKSVLVEDMDYQHWYKKYVEGEAADPLMELLGKYIPDNPELLDRIREDLADIPERHKEIAAKTIKNVVLTDTESSGYSATHKELRIKLGFEKGDMKHEIGHVLADAYKINDDPEYEKILVNGLENLGPDDIIEDETTFVIKIFRVEAPKLISLYQGRMYEKDGIWDGSIINWFSMREYFSEGYREFFMNPDNLHSKDPKLFEYIRGI